MAYNPDVDHRRSIRLPNFDYSQSGAYFITIVTHHRKCVFGDIGNDHVSLSIAGQCVDARISALPEYFPVEINHKVVMPNHVHFLVTLIESTSGNTPNSTETPRGTTPRSISAIVQNLKANSTRHIHQIWKNNEPVWQRNFYEHVVRDQSDFDRIYTYIENNPVTWQNDEFWK